MINAFLRKISKELKYLTEYSPPADTSWHITSKLLLLSNPKFANYSVGRFSYGDPTVLPLLSDAKLKIGSFVCFAVGVTILLGGEHNSDWVTTYNFDLIYDKFRNVKGRSWTKGDVVIGNDVWIGRDVLILSGVTIGDGAIIGARSVVAKDVSPYSIVAGNPARETRKRFPDDTIAKLIKMEWWNWDIQRIKENLPLLLSNNVKEFIDKNSQKIS
jgi:acetyltransferase-like isoleucine patch superfamily enzyme